MPHKNTNTNPNTTFIYTLQSGDDVRYVGKADNVKKRFCEHKATSGFKNPHLHRWMKQKGDVCISVVDEVLKSEWVFWEKWYIQLFKSWGFRLVNLTEGGDGLDGCIYDKELAEKKRRKSRVYAKGENHKLYGVTGKNHPAYGHRHNLETKKRMSELMIQIKSHTAGKPGPKHSEATKLKCSEIKKEAWIAGVYGSDEYKQKMRDVRLGKPLPTLRKPIMCNETGQVFDCTKEAAIILIGKESAAGNICSNLRGRLRSAYGYTFSYV